MSSVRGWWRVAAVVGWTVGATIAWVAPFVIVPLVEIYCWRHFGWAPFRKLFLSIGVDGLLIVLFFGIPIVGVGSFWLALNGKLPGTSTRPRPIKRGFAVESGMPRSKGVS